MQALFTDYDGTLSTMLVDRKGTDAPQWGPNTASLKAIGVWRKAGHIFGIATGRTLHTLLYEIERWQIPFDALLCCNGAVLYDHNLQLLHRSPLPDQVIPHLLEQTAVQESLYYAFSVRGKPHLHIRKQAPWFAHVGVPYEELNQEQSREIGDVEQINLRYDDVPQAQAALTSLQQRFPRQIEVHQSGPMLDITVAGMDKAKGLATLLALQGWQNRKVSVIGDGENDIPMLQQYGGYTVVNAGDHIKAQAHGVYADVGSLLRQLLDD